MCRIVRFPELAKHPPAPRVGLWDSLPHPKAGGGRAALTSGRWDLEVKTDLAPSWEDSKSSPSRPNNSRKLPSSQKSYNIIVKVVTEWPLKQRSPEVRGL